METLKTYDNFPSRIVLISNSVSIIIYISGFILTLNAGWIFAAIYLSFVLVFEYRLISTHCVNCFYWGRTCGFGKDKLSSMFFKKGDPSKFCEKNITWKEMIPDLLVSLFPLITGIVFLLIEFSFFYLVIVALLIAFTTVGNSFIRSNFTCKFCKQQELGCPAERLLSKTNNPKDSSN